MQVLLTHACRLGLLTLALLATVPNLPACSIYMAAKQPPKKNLDVLKEGTARPIVLAELGEPISTEDKDGKKVDIFYFQQGYSEVNKASRIAFHTVADVFTAGLWEVVATPGEAIFHGKKVAFEVTYDQDDKIVKVDTLQQ